MSDLVRDMSGASEANTCEFCRRGPLARRRDEIAFYQLTDRGYVYCHTTIPVSVCGHCQARTWDEAAEEAIRQAVDREYRNLP
jgi:hypothetical protein